MDATVSAALEEICSQGATGLSLSSLWSNLSPSLSSLGLPICPAVKSALWANLSTVPGLQFEANGVSYRAEDPKIAGFEECERVGVKIIAAENLRDCFVGIYDIKASDSGVSQVQRRVLERLAIARSNGITQSDLAKEMGIKGNNFFYIIRNLECRGLIVRHSTVLRTVEASSRREFRSGSVVTTNMLYLHRYAKHLGHQQRLEITKEDRIPVIDEDVNFDSLDGECAKEDVHVKDYLPALKAICDKLEVADDKVLVVADIKRDLGYKYTSGHRAWRNILHRLKDARVVEEFCAEVNKKEISCLRLLKSFSPKNFEPATYQHGDDDVSAEHLGKRGQITDLLLELPIEHQIYDMIDAEGSKGLTITEVCRRLGLNNKRYYTRLLNMFSRLGMHLEAENHNKGVAYRVWTPGNFSHEASTASLNKQEKVSNVNGASTSSAGDSNFHEKSSQRIPDIDVWTCEVDVGESGKLQENATESEPTHGSPTDFSIESTLDVSNVAPVELPSLVSSTPRRRKSYQTYPCLTMTAVSARREQLILQMLQEKKFIIRSELRRELDSVEKDKKTMTDRKTLHRALNKLQQEGHCKCISVSAPVVTNCGRSRITEVILQASLDVTPELLGQIHERLRSFEMEIRNQGLTRLKKGESVPILDSVQRILKKANSDVQAENSEAMRANGFVLAKMVRTKLLHIYLWSCLTNSPGWSDSLSSDKHGYDLKNPHSTCKLFSLDMAIKAMPLELFLQVVGSALKFEDMVEKCKRGLCLSDLPDDEYKRMMNTRAIGRLSWIVDVLRRLKLIRLVRDGPSEDNLTDVSHATLTYAMEVKPYIEEPVSVIAPSSGTFSLDLRPQIRHDFVLSSKEAVNAYWNTLEYSYSAADSRAALLAFPGSTVHEVFHFRSWASARVMTADQRAELRKRVANVDPNKKISYKECKEVAKDLNLTLEQVLRVYYDKRQQRPRSEEILDGQGDNLESHKKQVSSSRKRKRSFARRLSTTTTDDEPLNMKMPRSSDAENHFMQEQNRPLISMGEHDGLLEPSQYEYNRKAKGEAGISKEKDLHSLIRDCALSRMSKRNKRFAWTEKADRKLVVLYARQRVVLGAKFHRIEWSSLRDLPAPPDACKRRMAVLNSDMTFRKAMMRLCNVLGEKYAKYLDKFQSKPTSCGDSSIMIRNSVFEKSGKSSASDGIQHNDELCIEERWDNFEDENVKSALEEVLWFKIKKLSGSVAEQANLNISAKETDHLDTGMEIDNHASGNNIHTGNSSSRGLSRKYTKLLNEGLNNGRRTHESLAVSTAVELFKLIFLSTSSSPDAPNLLARTLRRYSENDLFVAFNYLREKKIMSGGTVGSPFVLSQKFLHNISSSPFPINTGKRATKFARWICEKEKDLIEEDMDLMTDLQCGDIFHICALVFTGEFSVSPCLPDEGVGEPEDSRIVKRKVDRNKVLMRDKAKKRKLSAGEVEISMRREKGFPGIRLALSRVRISKIDALEMFKDDHINSNIGEDDQVSTYASTNSIDTPFSSNICVEEISNEESSIPNKVAGTKSHWESMACYAEHLMSISANQQVNPFHPELFKNIYSAIQNAGDQGLTMEEITQIMNTLGKDIPELAVQALEAFGRAIKVNSYDSVRVVDSLYRSKYFLTSMATFSQHVEVALTTDSKTGNDHLKNQPEQHEKVNYQSNRDESAKKCVSKDLQPDDDGMHKITILNLPKDVSPPSVEVQHSIEGCDPVKDTSKGANHENKASEFYPGDFELCRPILPWVNGDGTTNIVYKGLQRRVLGLLMQNPGMLEDNIIKQMNVLNPQNCRELLKMMILDNHIIVRKMNESTSGEPPSMLSSLLKGNFQKSKLVHREHFFANPISTSLL